MYKVHQKLYVEIFEKNPHMVDYMQISFYTIWNKIKKKKGGFKVNFDYKRIGLYKRVFYEILFSLNF